MVIEIFLGDARDEPKCKGSQLNTSNVQDKLEKPESNSSSGNTINTKSRDTCEDSVQDEAESTLPNAQKADPEAEMKPSIQAQTEQKSARLEEHNQATMERTRQSERDREVMEERTRKIVRDREVMEERMRQRK